MKINKIEILNLNSLKGYWCIDFLNPDYEKNHNQFVICGETGSGKTTILDAITLALYGETPRHGTRAIEELMTKHTAKSMASVTYECKNGKYQSTFTLSRARGKLDGTLKRGFHIKNLESGEDTGNINAFDDIQAATQKIIQLDYSQFCRSILLAQGKFDTFISGKESERADILAKMSGIDYKDIGNQIWLKARENIRLYEGKVEKLGEIKILSKEEEAVITEELNGIPEQEKEIQKKTGLIIENLNWIKELGILEAERNNAQKARDDYETACRNFAEKRTVLEKSENALKCEGVFQSFKGLNDSELADRKNLESYTADFEKVAEKLSQMEENVLNAKKNLDSFENQKEENQKLWNAVRNLDGKIETYSEMVEEAKKRAKNSEQKFLQANENAENLQNKISELEKQINEHNEYVKQNAGDEKLAALIPQLKEKKNQADKSFEKISLCESQIQSIQKEVERLKDQKRVGEEEFTVCDRELQKFVTTEYKSIALILRRKLETGKACPVCGSIEHPVCGEKNEKEQVENGNANNLAVKVAELGEKAEKIKENIENLHRLIEKHEDGLTVLQKNVDDEKKELLSLQSGINAKVENWKVAVIFEKDSENFERLINQLEKKSAEFLQRSEAKKVAENQLENKKTELDGIKVEELKADFEKDKKEFFAEDEALQCLKDDRSKLFGTKDVDSETASFDNQLKTLRDSYETLKTQEQNSSNLKLQLETKINQTKDSINGRKEKLDQLKNEFEKVLKENSFSSINEFYDCRCSNEELEQLKSRNEELKKTDSSTLTSLNSAIKKYDAHNALKKTDKTEKELTEEKLQLETDLNKLLNRSGELKRIIAENDAKKEEAENLVMEVEKYKKNADVWSGIQGIIGKKDGSEFQVFVEVLAFKKLLKKANRYLNMISGKYTLVQVPGKVDFMVHDENFPDTKEDRPVTSMSGGERFIISLSLALGIAELASRNVQVNSLFLDEGFGTLSGQPLYESINALKSLQTSGKMLGIITHVDEVIKAFPQQIKAYPTKKNGGNSELSGSGVTYAQDWNGE